MLRIESSHSADLLLDVVPGLRARVDLTLRGLFEAPRELGPLNREAHAVDDRLLEVHIGSYRVFYTLNVDAEVVRILYIEVLEDAPRPPNPNLKAG